MWKHIAANALTLLIVAFVLLGGLVAMGQHAFTAPGPLSQAICSRSNTSVVAVAGIVTDWDTEPSSMAAIPPNQVQ